MRESLAEATKSWVLIKLSRGGLVFGDTAFESSGGGLLQELGGGVGSRMPRVVEGESGLLLLGASSIVMSRGMVAGIS